MKLKIFMDFGIIACIEDKKIVSGGNFAIIV